MMTQPENEAAKPPFSSRLGGFLKRLLLAFIKLGLILIVIVGVLGITWLIYREISRSFNVVNSRIDFNREQNELIQEDITDLMSAIGKGEKQLAELQTTAATREATIAGLESQLAMQQGQHEEALARLEEQVSTLMASTDIISGNLAFLGDGLVSLQGDTTANVTDIDTLGGELDTLQANLEGLSGDLEAVYTELGTFSAEEFDRMRYTLALFRIWEMVSRARLHLLEQNIGLAAEDIETAQSATNLLIIAIPEEEETTRTGLNQVQERLTLAGIALPDDQATAARDLETAWELLDAALANLFGDPPPPAPVTPTPEAEASS